MFTRWLAGSMLLIFVLAADAQTDRHGDALPAGVRLRLGTVRLRHADSIRAIAFSPDGKILASAGKDRVIRLWHPTTGKSLKELTGHTGIVVALAFSPDSKRLASAMRYGDDDTVRCWRPADRTAPS
jgi:WD40 repeat protein